MSGILRRLASSGTERVSVNGIEHVSDIVADEKSAAGSVKQSQQPTDTTGARRASQQVSG